MSEFIFPGFGRANQEYILTRVPESGMQVVDIEAIHKEGNDLRVLFTSDLPIGDQEALRNIVEDALRHSASQFNAGEAIYIRGSEDIDGSERVRFGSGGNPQIERRADGVWNLGELELARDSLVLGPETKLSVAGHHLLVGTEAELPSRHLLPASEFDDSGSKQPTIVLLGQRLNNLVVRPDESLSLTNTIHTEIVFIFVSAFFLASYYRTGAVGATAPVTVTLTEGVPPNDVIFFQEIFPASVFPADSEVRLDLAPGLIFPFGIQVNIEFKSEVAFTMKFDATGTFFRTALDIQIFVEEPVFSFPTGTNLFLSDSAGSLIVDNKGNMMASGL